MDGQKDYELSEYIGHEDHSPSMIERPKDALNKSREELEVERERDQEEGKENERETEGASTVI